MHQFISCMILDSQTVFNAGGKLDVSWAWWWSDCRWSVWCRWPSPASRDGRSQRADGRPRARGSAGAHNESQPEQTTREKTNAIMTGDYKRQLQLQIACSCSCCLVRPWEFHAINTYLPYLCFAYSSATFYAIDIRFYPKRLTLHWLYLWSVHAFAGNWTHDLGVAQCCMVQHDPKPAYCIIFDAQRSLSDQHDQNLAVKPVAQNPLHAFYRLIDSLDFFSKQKAF